MQTYQKSVVLALAIFTTTLLASCGSNGGGGGSTPLMVNTVSGTPTNINGTTWVACMATGATTSTQITYTFSSSTFTQTTKTYTGSTTCAGTLGTTTPLSGTGALTGDAAGTTWSAGTQPAGLAATVTATQSTTTALGTTYYSLLFIDDRAVPYKAYIGGPSSLGYPTQLNGGVFAVKQ
ncbi:MAG: hypothetical protein OEV94_04690 [Deltaproteobacteria bacterium]|nr:hypothetical protein [Deltaproteobacteria bacterium]